LLRRLCGLHFVLPGLNRFRFDSVHRASICPEP
jgi:hypothetical protein